MVKFAVPYNGDLSLIDKALNMYPEYIESFFGNLGIDNFGGGRAQTEEILNTTLQLKNIISKLDVYNIDFNYVINNTSLMNEEFEPAYVLKFDGFLEKLIEIGVKKITLSNPFLIMHVKNRFPELKISASVNLKTRSVEEVKYLISLGCDEATLHYDLIKNFKELKLIRKETDMLFKLIPNDLYIMNCPWQKGHTRMQGSHSKVKDVSTPYFSYYRNKCVKIRNIEPEQIYMGKWIAPCDIKEYENIGFSNFKLLDRLATTEWILNAMKIYIEQKRNSNLEEILGTYGRRSNINIESFEDFDVESEIYPMEQLELVPEINQKKNISYWFSENHLFNCSSCNLCKSKVEKEMVFPENKRLQYIENNKQWQTRITKTEFIEQLESSLAQRISYK